MTFTYIDATLKVCAITTVSYTANETQHAMTERLYFEPCQNMINNQSLLSS